MSIGSGSFPLARLQLLKEQKDLQFSSVIAKLQEHRIAPIGLDDVTESAFGWCHPHTGEPDFSDARDWLQGDRLLFGLRMDAKKVPAALLRLQVQSLLEEMQQQEKKKTGKKSAAAERPESSRRLKDLAKERVKNELLRRTLPVIRWVEVVWNLKTGEIWLASSSSAVFETFDQCFGETFTLPYVFKTPGTLGLDFAGLVGQKPSSQKPALARLDALTQVVPWGSLVGEEAADQRVGASAEKAPSALPPETHSNGAESLDLPFDPN